MKNLLSLSNIKNNQRVIFSTLLILFITALWFFKLEPFYKLSLQVNDFKYFFNDKKPHKDVVFLAVDEKSVNEFGRWPWDREVLAQGLDKLVDAKAVVLDIVFSEKTTEEKDEALANSFENIDNTICGFFLRSVASSKLDIDSKEVLTESALERVNIKNSPFMDLPFAEVNIIDLLENCSLNAFFSTFSDKDGLFRKYPIAFTYDNHIYPSLGIQTLRYVFNKDIEIKEELNQYNITLNNKEINIDENGFVQLNYYRFKNYQIISFSDIYKKDFDKTLIEDKIIVIGISEAGVTDIRATPLGQIPGPLLHYTFISNMLQDILLKENKTLELFLIISLGLLATFLNKFQKNLNLRIVFYLGIFSAITLTSFITYLYFNIWINIFYPVLSFAVVLVFNGIYLLKAKEKETKFIKDAFSNYMSPAFVNEIIKNPDILKLGGEKKEVSVLFSDIRGFTTLSESVKPEELISILELYFTPMTNLVIKNSGTLDKYIGDAIMAFYNAPIDVENHPDLAVQTALEMTIELEKINKTLNKKSLPSLDFGVGINTDEAIIGNIGSAKRFDYSVVGDGVNLASRVEGLTKTYACHTIITEYTYKKLSEDFLTRELDLVKVKGKTYSVKIYEVMLENERNKKIKELYEKAYDLHKQEQFIKAKDLFLECFTKYEDKTSNAFIKLHYEKES